MQLRRELDGREGDKAALLRVVAGNGDAKPAASKVAQLADVGALHISGAPRLLGTGTLPRRNNRRRPGIHVDDAQGAT